METMATSDHHTSTTHSPWTTTTPNPIGATCARSPMLPPVEPETNENYIENPCVAMLSFGTWVEKSCLEKLPFICYEDRFYGEIKVTNVTVNNATLTWTEAPGDIDHYRVEVEGDVQTVENQRNLTTDLGSLTAGTRYTVQVFPVKCGRDLNPQTETFYTVPHKVKDLKVIDVAESSVVLSWNKPDGNADLYSLRTVESPERDIKTNVTEEEVDGLLPGSFYTVLVLSGVEDESRWSEESNITVCTKPGKVSNLQASNNTNNSLLLSWEAPEGNFTGFKVKATSSSNESWYSKEVSRDERTVNVTDLPNGSEIRLFVTTVANHTLDGDSVNITSYTAPGPISQLVLTMGYSSLNATWDRPNGSFSIFTVEVWQEEKLVANDTTTETYWESSDNLKSSTGHKVVVYAVTGHLKGPAVSRSNFTCKDYIIINHS
ncbi:tenascin-R-like [Cololabis saira]|uniref:tenascin-R-like n=1 Tax=Cololabis saira TaxID=129043 RepID=UPI002AD5906E|nr:tenascin-R-like [Cololabis saira]